MSEPLTVNQVPRRGSRISGRRNGARADCRTSEDGDTLIELLITIVVTALAAVSLIAAFGAEVAASSVHRNLATIDLVLKDFAESATYQIQLSPSYAYQACATFDPTMYAYNTSPNTPTYIPYGPATLSYQPPVKYKVRITSIQYLSGSTLGASLTSTTFVSSCPSSSVKSPQLITAEATGPRGSSDTLSFVVAYPHQES